MSAVTATVTSKGQITIPTRVREALGLDAGDQVVFVVENGRAIMNPVKRKGLEGLRGFASGRAPFPGREAERKAAEAAAVAEVLRKDRE